MKHTVKTRREFAIDLLRDQLIEVALDGDDYVRVGDRSFRVHKDKLVALMEAGRLELDTILRISREALERLTSEALRELNSQLEIFEIIPTSGHAGTWRIDFVDADGEHIEVAIGRRIVGMDELGVKAHIKAKLINLDQYGVNA